MKYLVAVLLSIMPVVAHAAPCSQLELNIGLDKSDCGKYNAVELTVIKSQIETNDGKYVHPPRFVFMFGSKN